MRRPAIGSLFAVLLPVEGVVMTVGSKPSLKATTKACNLTMRISCEFYPLLVHKKLSYVFVFVFRLLLR